MITNVIPLRESPKSDIFNTLLLSIRMFLAAKSLQQDNIVFTGRKTSLKCRTYIIHPIINEQVAVFVDFIGFTYVSIVRFPCSDVIQIQLASI